MISFYICIFGWAFKEFHWHFMVICYMSGTFYLFIYFCFWLGTHTWTSFPINCLWNCSNLNHNTNVNFHYSIHVWTTLMLLLYLWLSFQRISLTFYGHVLHIQYISPFLAKNSCVNVVTQKLFLKLLQNSIKVCTNV